MGPGGAAAQSPPPPPVQAPPVRVEGDAPESATPARDATPFRTVIDPATHAGGGLGRALETVPGATVRRSGGHREELLLRGASGGQVAVFLDDVPLTGARGGSFDLSLVPPELLGSAEVLRGPNAATYGGGALGGVLHLHTPPVGPGRRRAAAFALGSFGERGLRLAEAYGDDDFDVIGLIGATHTDGDFVYHDVRGDARRRRNNARDALSGLARGRVRLGDDTTLTLLLVGLDDTRGEPGIEQFERPEAESTRGRLLLAAAADDPSLLDGRVVGGVSVHAARQTDAYRDPVPTLWGAPRSAGLEDDSVGARAQATWASSALHLPRLAVEARREVARTRVDGAETRENRRLGLAAVLSDEVGLLGERLVVGAALRLDDTDARGPLLVPQGGLTVQPLDAVPGLRLRANVGRVFRDPSVDELYWRAPGLRGNPALAPEDGLAWDAGLELALRDTATFGAAAFGQRYDHLILWMPVQAHLVEAQGHHGATVTGQEVTLAARGGPLGLNAAYTHLDARFDAAPRTPLPHRPAHRVSARVDAAIGQARLFVGLERRSEVRADRFGYRRVPGHGLWDAGLSGPVGGGFEVDLTFRNLTHELSARDAVQQPLPGRTWLFTLRYLPPAAGEET